MSIWIYTDGNNRILSINPNPMDGNTGWKRVECDLPAVLTNEHGIPLYTYSDGIVVARSAEEVAADYTPPERQPTEAERIASLEQQNKELQESNLMLTECLLEMSEIVYA